MEYLLNDDEKKEMVELLEKDGIIAEQEKAKRYNPNDIFKDKVKSKTQDQEDVSLVEVKIEKWYEKIFSFFRNMFKK